MAMPRNHSRVGVATPTAADGTLKLKTPRHADVAELADALDLGSSARKGVGVQVSPSAPI